MRRAKKVAVIGGGASGALVCAQLLRGAGRRPLRIDWIGKQTPFGRGLAYGTREPSHLLNVPVEGMSAYPQEPGHFLAWLKERRPELGLGPRGFAPRLIYGEYLGGLVPQDEPRVRRYKDEAWALSPRGRGYRVRLKKGGWVDADEVVLAVGNVQTAPLRGSLRPQRLGKVPADARVLLVGTGLTMLDAVLSLRVAGHRGRITAVSRRGQLPRVHADYAAHRPSKAFQALLRSGKPSLARATRLFRLECEAAAAAGSDWRAVFDLIRPHTGRLWRRLGAARRRSFLRHLRPYWDAHRHRAAPEILAQIEALEKEGVFELRRGRGLRAAEGFDVAADCTGLIARISRAPSPLLRAALRDGLLELDEPELGLHASFRHPHLHVLGPLLRGRLWESVAVPEIRVQARAVARKILGRSAIC